MTVFSVIPSLICFSNYFNSSNKNPLPFTDSWIHFYKRKTINFLLKSTVFPNLQTEIFYLTLLLKKPIKIKTIPEIAAGI